MWSGRAEPNTLLCFLWPKKMGKKETLFCMYQHIQITYTNLLIHIQMYLYMHQHIQIQITQRYMYISIKYFSDTQRPSFPTLTLISSPCCFAKSTAFLLLLFFLGFSVLSLYSLPDFQICSIPSLSEFYSSPVSLILPTLYSRIWQKPSQWRKHSVIWQHEEAIRCQLPKS